MVSRMDLLFLVFAANIQQFVGTLTDNDNERNSTHDKSRRSLD